MKFLSQLYRESQQDWFGQGEGVFVAYICCFQSVKGWTLSQWFAHVIQQCGQDTTCINMQHALKTLKAQDPEITTAFYRQGSTACYRFGNTILVCLLVGKSTGIQVRCQLLRMYCLDSAKLKYLQPPTLKMVFTRSGWMKATKQPPGLHLADKDMSECHLVSALLP